MRNIIESTIKKYRNQCDYLEIRIEDRTSLNIVLKDKDIDSVKKAFDKGGCVRAAYKGGWGFCSFNDIAKLEEFVMSAISQAKLVGTGETKLAQVPVVDDYVKLALISDPREVSIEDKLALLNGYNDIVMSSHKNIKNSTVVYFDLFRTVTFANSDGTYIVQDMMDSAIGVSAMAQKNGIIQGTFTSRGTVNDYNIFKGLEAEVKENCMMAVKLLDAPKVKGGTYPVICNTQLTGVFVHEAFGHTSEADIYGDNPKMAEVLKIGNKYGSDVLNIYDTGLTEGCRGYLKYDDEGVKTEKTYLIRNGILTSRLHTRETAAKMGEKPTGSAKAMSYRYSPICRMRNTSIEEGQSTLEEMISDIKLGIYAIDSRGGAGGEMFSFTAGHAYMIRDGKIEELVRDAKLIGNLFVTLNNIDMVGNDYVLRDGPGGCGKGSQFPVAVSHGSPHIRIQNLTVGGE